MPVDVGIPKSKTPGVVAEVNHREGTFVLQNPGPTTNHLVVKGEGFCGTVQDDGFHRGFVETRGQNRHRGKHRVGSGVEPMQDVRPLFFTVGVVQVHAGIALLFEHGLDLLGGVDAVVEDEGLRAFCFLLVSVEQFLLHQEVAVKPFRGTDSIIPVDANLQGPKVHVVAVGPSLGQKPLAHQIAYGFTNDELRVVVVQRQLDVAGKWGGGHAQEDLAVKVLEQLSEAVVVGFVHHHQSQVGKFDLLVVEAVVQGFHHRHKTPMVVAVFELLDLAVDDFVGNPNFREHGRGLAQKFNPVRQNQDPLARFQDEALGQLRENHRFSAPGRKLVKQVVTFGEFPNAGHDGVDRILLITIKFLALFALHALGNCFVDGQGFGHG